MTKTMTKEETTLEPIEGFPLYNKYLVPVEGWVLKNQASRRFPSYRPTIETPVGDAYVEVFDNPKREHPAIFLRTPIGNVGFHLVGSEHRPELTEDYVRELIETIFGDDLEAMERAYGRYLIERHDWTYMMSDDHRAYSSGRKRAEKIEALGEKYPEIQEYYERRLHEVWDKNDN